MGGASSSTGMGSYGGGMARMSPGISSPGMSSTGMQLGGMSPGGMNGGVPQQKTYAGGASSYSAGGDSYGSRAGYAGGATASKYGRSGSSPYQSTYNSSMGSGGRKKPSKRTLMAMLVFVCAIIWVLLGE